MKALTEYSNKRVLVTLDMTYIDSVLINYLVFLKEKLGIEHLIFFHNIWFNNADNGADILSKLDQPLVEILEKKIEEEVKEHFSENEYTIKVKENSNLQLQFLIEFTDDANGSGGADERVEGTLESVLTEYRSTGPYVESESPTITVLQSL